MNARISAAPSAPSRADIKKAIRKLRGISLKGKDDQFYRLDRRSVSSYRLEHDWCNPEYDILRTIKARGGKVVYVDVCGRATGESLWADETYTFSLQSLDRVFWKEKTATHVQGDLFNPRDFYGFIRLLRKKRVSPAFVTFHPVAGLQSYTPWSKDNDPVYDLIVFQRLANNLQKMIEILKPGGFIHLGKPFQLLYMDMWDFLNHVPRKEWKSHLWLKTFCRKMRCSLEQGFSGDQDCHLIRKWKSSKKNRS